MFTLIWLVHCVPISAWGAANWAGIAGHFGIIVEPEECSQQNGHTVHIHAILILFVGMHTFLYLGVVSVYFANQLR